ncbi:hypothetical protein COT75_04355 [Candidatus Beckwithbacteria bacterium CG10_big_fil_rev_8_21_14_0_10_34_10]|uniref:Uncharacterized protein n=1 Tax=Candidatus Beckwithbacteria bacterium CG10_big_fil_rev_8_21_14_0_10_34_10 TaxID=1974495 RepID=A0A2H0W898_9BACT|nr:MAG: hypothetical protein COT75_04355 [Candidatus Beckwithbacteria bacterium CG10_big_fil_rev_8_21_14_0_10_34_10]
MKTAQSPIRASTQDHLPIKEIKDGLVLLKNNSSCLVLKTTAINFGLLSEKEQEATIFAYAALLNSLTFQIQILIQSRQKDISGYLKLISQRLTSAKNEKYKIQLKSYYRFIENIVQKNKILDKKFYLIIPYAPIAIKGPDKIKIERAKTDLYPKRNHLIGQFQRIGLRASQLNNQELIELFYAIYNPGARGQKFSSLKDYSSPLVQPQLNKKITKNIPLNSDQSISPFVNQPVPVEIKSAPDKIPGSQTINQQNERVLVTPKVPIPSPIPKSTVQTNQPTTIPLEGQELQKQINQVVKNVTSGDQIKNNNQVK